MIFNFSNIYKIKDTKGNLLGKFSKDVKEIKLNYKAGTWVDLTPLNDCESIEHIQLIPIDGRQGRAILPRKLPNLKRLIIGLYVENPEVLVNFSNLEVLDIRGNSPDNIDLILNFPKLKSFGIDGYNLNTIEPLGNFPDLEELDLLSCPKADMSPLSGCKKLKKLRLAFDPKESEVLKELTNLEDLTLDSFQTNVLDYLVRTTKLTRLLLYRSRMKDFHSLQNLLNLTYLDLSLTRIDNQNLKYLSGLKKLSYLNLMINRRITDIFPLGQLLNLEDLDMSIIKGTINSLEPLRNLKKLKKLNLLRTPIKNDGFDPLLEIQSLKKLIITTSDELQIKKLKKTLKNCEITVEPPPDPSTVIDIGFVQIWLTNKGKTEKDCRYSIFQDVADELKLDHNLEAEDLLINHFKKENPEILKNMDFFSFHEIFQVTSTDKLALTKLAQAMNKIASN